MSPRIEHLAEGKVILHPGDCLDVMRELANNTIDSCVTDPPYGLGFMGKHWDHGVPGVKYWREVFRVLKPGAHLLSFGGTRTYHRMVCAIEDAGFEIRDSLQWLYGSGFPKSHDVSKGIDKAAGAERDVVGVRKFADGTSARRTAGISHEVFGEFAGAPVVTAPATDAAREWQGWGTALKPACEPIVLARKPLSESTVAANVLKWGTGALNIDGCRIATESGWQDYVRKTARPNSAGQEHVGDVMNRPSAPTVNPSDLGRWPANLIHDGSEEVLAGFPDARSSFGGGHSTGERGSERGFGYHGAALGHDSSDSQYFDSGSAARFFYCAKADSDNRLGSKHPTVKPVDLMQWLVRLVTPRGGTCLDPFSGTGTTGEAAFREGMLAILIEREEEYQDDIRRRMALVMAGPEERSRESIKAKTKDKPVDHGPLFAPAPAKQEVLGI